MGQFLNLDDAILCVLDGSLVSQNLVSKLYLYKKLLIFGGPLDQKGLKGLDCKRQFIVEINSLH